MPKFLVITLFAFAVVLGTACGQTETAPASTPIPAREPSTPTATPTPATEPAARASLTATPTPPQSSTIVSPTPAPTGSPIASATPTAVPISIPARVELASDIVEFILQDLTIEVGTRVLWINRDVSSHTSTAGAPGGITGIWDSGNLATGISFSFTFDQTGVFPYFCEIHPFMLATVTVVDSLPGGPIVSVPPPTPTQEPLATDEPTPTPTHEAMVMEPPTLTPTPTNGAVAVVVTPTPTPEAKEEETTSSPSGTPPDLDVQEFAIIENYAATRFFPKEIVVLRGIPVKLYLTRLHREHVNQFAIPPFFSSNQEILPGQVGLIQFLPDELGEFKIRNVGHSFEASLVVVETMADVRQHFLDKGVKMFALIQSDRDSRVFPEKSFVVKDVPVRIFKHQPDGGLPGLRSAFLRCGRYQRETERDQLFRIYPR